MGCFFSYLLLINLLVHDNEKRLAICQNVASHFCLISEGNAGFEVVRLIVKHYIIALIAQIINHLISNKI